VVDPSGKTVYAGTDSGVYVSDNGGNYLNKSNAKSFAKIATDVWSLAIDPINSNILDAQEDNSRDFTLELTDGINNNIDMILAGKLNSSKITIYDPLNESVTARGSVEWIGGEFKSGNFTQRGTVKNPFGNVVGQIWINKNCSDIKCLKITRFPDNLESKLQESSPTMSYWDSIPSCDVATAKQNQINQQPPIQSAVDTIHVQNQLQTLRFR
jgi:hypothetical protein